MNPENVGAVQKSFKSISELTQLLESRGLFLDVARGEVAEFLRGVNYYRFTGYAIPFLLSREQFREGSRFSEIKAVYEFDRKLRTLIGEALGVIELTFRTNFAREFSRMGSPLMYLEAAAYRDEDEYRNALSMVMGDYKQSVERCAQHFKFQGVNPPFWALVEVTTFGHLSRLFRALKNEYRNPIAQCYGYASSKAVSSLLQHLTVLRNRCAHHSRIYDLPWGQQDDPKDVVQGTKLDKRRQYIFSMLPEWRALEEQGVKIPKFYPLFYQLALIYRFLIATPIAAYDAQDWKRRVVELLESVPRITAQGVNLKALLHIPDKLQESPIWDFPFIRVNPCQSVVDTNN